MALLEAAKNDDVRAMQTLLEEGLDLQESIEYSGAKGSLGADALCFASFVGSANAVQVLLDFGVSPDATWDGKGAQYQAASQGHFEVLKALVEASLDLGSRETALAAGHAARRGRLDMIRLLVENGLDVNLQPSPNTWTLLLGAAANGHTELVEFLLQNGADPEQATRASSKDGTSELHTPRSRAIQNGHLEIVEMLDEFDGDR